MVKAFAYLRVSGKGQVSGDGFPRQLEAVKQYAAAHNLKIAKVFQDEGVSGTKGIEDRPAFEAMFSELLAGGTRVVLIEKLDRLARDLMMQETIIGTLRRAGCKLVSVAEPDLCSDDPSRVMVRQFFGSIAQYEKSTLVLKLKAARQRAKARTGRCEGRKAFGDRPGEAKAVKRAQSLRTAGMSWAMVAQTLEGEGFKTRYGKPWIGASIRKIVVRAAS